MRNLLLLMGLALVAALGWHLVASRLPVCPRPTGTPAFVPADSSDAEGAPQTLDDRRRCERLLSEGQRLLRSKEATPMSVLIGQLDRAACRLVLPEPPAAPLPPHDLAERVLPSVLAVGRLYKCTKCTRVHVSVATGFVISASGACVTNYHVVNEPDSETLVAMTADGRVLAVREVLAASRADDVVLLRVDAADLPPLPLAADAPVGTPVWILSHPDRRFYTLTSGLVSRHFLMAETGGASPRMAVTADYARGSSGAPVFDARGVVVGVAESTHSVYYDKDDDGRPRNLQMVFHNAVPARSVLGLIRRER